MVSPPFLVWPAGAYDPVADRVVMFGGLDENGLVTDETWAWDGTAWTQLFPATSPSGRFTHGMVYDPLLGRIVLFGGITEQFGRTGLADTWEWDGTTWTETTPAVSPPGRGAHRNMAFDPAGGYVVLFGGGTQPSQPTRNDAWVYDGAWTQLNPPTVPSSRVGACMGTDTSLSRVLMYGGGQWQNPYESDTWSIANGNFSLLNPMGGPPGLQSANCTYDNWRDRFVVHGGGTSQSPFTLTNATWEFDGNAWVEASLAGGPSANCCAILATNPGGRGLMLFAEAQTWVLEPPVVP